MRCLRLRLQDQTQLLTSLFEQLHRFQNLHNAYFASRSRCLAKDVALTLAHLRQSQTNRVSRVDIVASNADRTQQCASSCATTTKK